MKEYKVSIRIKDRLTNKIIHNKKIFKDYHSAIKYIDDNLSQNHIIKMKFFENNNAFGYGSIFYVEDELCNYNEAINLLKELFNFES